MSIVMTMLHIRPKATGILIAITTSITALDTCANLSFAAETRLWRDKTLTRTHWALMARGRCMCARTLTLFGHGLTETVSSTQSTREKAV